MGIIDTLIICKECGAKFTLKAEKEHYSKEDNINNLLEMNKVLKDQYLNGQKLNLPNKCFSCRNISKKLKKEY